MVKGEMKNKKNIERIRSQFFDRFFWRNIPRILILALGIDFKFWDFENIFIANFCVVCHHPKKREWKWR